MPSSKCQFSLQLVLYISLHRFLDASFRRAKLFRFDASSNEWKERGTGEVRLLQHKETRKVRLVMRRDKTLKVCANHLSTSHHIRHGIVLDTDHEFQVTSEMKLQPNIGSDRSWVWKVAADYSENPPTAETLAIRFANSDSELSESVFCTFRLTLVRCRPVQEQV